MSNDFKIRFTITKRKNHYWVSRLRFVPVLKKYAVLPWIFKNYWLSLNKTLFSRFWNVSCTVDLVSDRPNFPSKTFMVRSRSSFKIERATKICIYFSCFRKRSNSELRNSIRKNFKRKGCGAEPDPGTEQFWRLAELSPFLSKQS